MFSIGILGFIVWSSTHKNRLALLISDYKVINFTISKYNSFNLNIIKQDIAGKFFYLFIKVYSFLFQDSILTNKKLASETLREVPLNFKPFYLAHKYIEPNWLD